MEDAYEIESMHRFVELDLAYDAMLDETTILKFRHLLEKHAQTSQMMNIINDTLAQRDLLLKGSTMADATIIHAPLSTKNHERKRDPECIRRRTTTVAASADSDGWRVLMRG